MTISDALPPTPAPRTTTPLTSVAIGRLLRARFGVGDLELVRRCHELTGGDPDLLEHVLDALESAGPPIDLDAVDRLEHDPPAMVVASVVRTLHDLTEPVRAVAEAASVAGSESTMSRLTQLAERSKEETRTAIAELVAAGILCRDDAPTYRSPLEAAAVRSLLGGTRRRGLHRTMATVLHAQGGADMVIAHHLSMAGPTGEPWAGSALLCAARQSARAGDHASAVRWLRQALDEPLDDEDQCRVLDALAGSEQAVGDPAAVGRLRALAHRTGAPEQRLRLARALITQATPWEAVAELDSMLDTTRDTAIRRRVKLQMLTALRHDLGLRPRSHELVAELTEELRADVEADAGSLTEVAYEHALAGTPCDVVLELAQRALHDARRSPLGAHHAQALFLTLVTAGDLPGAQRLVRLREQAGDASTVQLHRRGVLAFATGAMEDAVDLATRALEHNIDVPIMRPSSAALLARCLVRLGRIADATEVLEPIVADRSLTTLVTYHPVLLARAELGRAQGDWESALGAAEECADFSARMGTDNPVVVPWHPVAAEALDALGRIDDAIALASEALSRIDRFGFAPAGVRAPLDDIVARVPQIAAAELPAVRTVRVIGDGAVETGTEVVPLGDDLVDRTLRYLAVHERPVLREELVEALWPDVDPAAGRHRLRKLLSRLRSRHGDVVVSTGSQLGLAPDVEVDLRRFRQLARTAQTSADADAALRAGTAALELARGDVCPLDRYDDWALAVDADHRRERERVRGLIDGLTASRRADPPRSRQPPAVPT